MLGQTPDQERNSVRPDDPRAPAELASPGSRSAASPRACSSRRARSRPGHGLGGRQAPFRIDRPASRSRAAGGRQGSRRGLRGGAAEALSDRRAREAEAKPAVPNLSPTPHPRRHPTLPPGPTREASPSRAHLVPAQNRRSPARPAQSRKFETRCARARADEF